MMEMRTEAERYAYLEGVLAGKSGGYCVVVYDGKTELIWFSRHLADGSLWYLEAPCVLQRIEAPHDEAVLFYTERGYVLKEDGFLYEVDSPQVSPFLPEELAMHFLGVSEEAAVDWLLANSYAKHEWRKPH